MSIFTETTISFVKGAAIGAGAVIPGVSGGTTAVVLGVFEDVLESTANIFMHVKQSLKTLLPLCFGAIVGVMICSPSIKALCEIFPIASKYFFCFISLLSTFLFSRTSIQRPMKNILFIVTGTITALLISYVFKSGHNVIMSDSGIVLFVIGVLLSLALILPAISFSYMLLFFGLYEKTLNAVTDFNIFYLISLGSGIVLGALFFSKLLLKLISVNSQETYSFVLGFVVCSVVDILV